MNRFTSVIGLSDARRLPRIGRLRLGRKEKKGDKTYPVETDYFVIDTPGADASSAERGIHEKFVAAYGPKPKVLDILLPVEQREHFFPQAYKLYGAAGLKCVGDGQQAERLSTDKTFRAVKEGCAGPERCECSLKNGRNGKPGCKYCGSLFVMLPKVSLAGYFQIVTGSKSATIAINTSLEQIRQMFGRVAGLAFMNAEDEAETVLRLVRRPTKLQHEGSTRVHYLMALEPRIDLQTFLRLKAAGALPGGQAASALPNAAAAPALAAPKDVDPETGELRRPPTDRPVTPEDEGEQLQRELDEADEQRPADDEELSQLLNETSAPEPPKVIDLKEAIAGLSITDRAKQMLLARAAKNPEAVRTALREKGIAC